jgi:CubicO group peptidase (beta-lactamase class C family)
MTQTNRKRFRKIFKWLLGFLLFLVLVAAGIYLWAALSTGTSLLARGILWGDSDAGDLLRFPTRPMQASSDPISFEPSAEDNLSQIPITETAIQPDPLTLAAFLERTHTTAFIVLHDDRLLYERYFNGSGREAIQASFSAAKSFTSSLVGIAIEEGFIESLDDPITRYLPELLERDPRFEQITIRHLITMTSGLRWDRSDDNPFSDDFLTYYATDLRETALESEIVELPGGRFLYNDYNPVLIGLILERATGMSVSKYMESRLWKPIGAEGDGSWSLDSERSGFEKMFVGVNGRAIDLIKLGWLFLNNGVVGGRQVVPASWVEEATAPDATGDRAAGYGYYWWVDSELGGFYAEGDKCQFIYVYPQADLVLARFGTDCGDFIFNVGWMKAIAQYVAAELLDDRPA